MVGYIYCIICKANGKWYFGQTNHSIKSRWNSHIRCALNHKENSKFHRAIRKYGSENFIVEETMWVEAQTKEKLKNKLDFLERYFINRYSTKFNGYNSTFGGDGVLGLEFSKSAKIKMAKTWFKKGSIPWNKGMKGVTEAWNKQKAFSFESRKKLSDKNKGKKPWNYGKKLTEEHKRKLSEGHRHPLNRSPIKRNGIVGILEDEDTILKLKSGKYIRVVEQYSLEGEYIQTFESINDAKKKLKISNISACCKGKYNTAGGYIWRFKLLKK